MGLLPCCRSFRSFTEKFTPRAASWPRKLPRQASLRRTTTFLLPGALIPLAPVAAGWPPWKEHAEKRAFQTLRPMLWEVVTPIAAGSTGSRQMPTVSNPSENILIQSANYITFKLLYGTNFVSWKTSCICLFEKPEK